MKITVEYETLEDFKYDQSLIQKGQAFDDMSELLRSCVKYDLYKEFYKDLDLNHKVTSAALDDISYKICSLLREKLIELLSHHTD